MILEPDYLDFLKLLNNNNVEYMVIGGYALSAHESPRYTQDIDIWVKPEKLNSEKVIKAIDEFGFGSLGIKSEDFLSTHYFVQLGYAPVRIDLTADISGVSFEEAYGGKKMVEVGGILIPFIGIQALIKNKLASGRDQDLVDVKKLQKIVAKKKDK